MFRLTRKSLAANKVRFALTTFGVILAVSFVVAAFVLGDGLKRSFADVSEEITAGIDLEVRNVADFGEPPPLPPDTVATVAAVDGVADAVASVEGADNAVRPIRPNGELIPTDGPPQLAFNWIDNEQLSAFTLVDGTAPAVGEFTMDVDSADTYGFVVGDTYELLVPGGRVELTMSGTSIFGADNATLGAVLLQMNTAEASELFGIGGIDAVAVELAEGADPAAVRTAIATAVPTAEVVDHDTVLAETTTGFTKEIDVVAAILLGFGGVALFVSAFIVYNTFAIVVGQRSRELALLRTVGADAGQVRRSVLGEGLIVGVLAAVGGIGGGIAVAKGIEAMFGLMGVDLIDYPLILAPRTFIAAAVIGIGVTLLASMGPARRAATVAPIAILHGTGDDSPGTGRRAFVGLGFLGAGLAAGAAGLIGIGSTAVTTAGLAFGAITLFVGVTVLSPLAVGAITRVFGWPLRKLAGVAGGLAEHNAARNARRTATTAAALMIGLTLVSTALVVGASVKSTLGTTLERSAKADYYLTDDLDEVAFPDALVTELQQSGSVAAAAGFKTFEARVGGRVTDVVALDFHQVGDLLDLDVVAGALDAGVVNPLVLSADEASAVGAGLGDALSVEVASGVTVQATVVGLFDDQTVLTDDYLVDTTVVSSLGLPLTADWLAVSFAAGASPAEVSRVLDQVAGDHPDASIETAAQFRERVSGEIDKVLTMVNVMVALAVVIALIGIANTMALSVFERTRELGLVRAVGMTRRQVRRMVRLEAALVAVFGATLGVALGLLFGFGVVTALPATVASSLSVPAVPILVLVLVAAVAGMVAAWLPARRAGRLDVLDAIAH